MKNHVFPDRQAARLVDRAWWLFCPRQLDSQVSAALTLTQDELPAHVRPPPRKISGFEFEMSPSDDLRPPISSNRAVPATYARVRHALRAAMDFSALNSW
jgi:hypothetical protein